MKPTLFLLKHTPQDLWAVSTKDSTARDQLKSLVTSPSQPIARPTFRVLVAYVDQLHDFVQQAPPLAWELLEYAQEPLEIVYPERKFTISEDEDAPSICVRWVKHPKLLKFLMKEGPVWAAPISPFNEGKVPPFPFRTVDCYDKNYPYTLVKTMIVNVDGTFTFLY